MKRLGGLTHPVNPVKNPPYRIVFVYLVILCLSCSGSPAPLELLEDLDLSKSEELVQAKIENLLDMVRENPEVAEHWGRLGMNLYIHDFKQESIPVFKEAARLEKNEFFWPYFCAIVSNELNCEDTSTWFERSKVLNPAYPPLHVRLGNYYLKMDELTRSAESFADALATGYDIPQAHVGIAKVLLQEGNPDKARTQLEKALKLAPEYREAYSLLAEVHSRAGDRQKAQDIILRLSLLPEKLDLADPVYSKMVAEGVSSFWCQVRASSYLSQGRLRMAEKELKAALKARPNAESYKNLGYVYQRMNKPDKAVTLYTQALGLDSNYVDALNNLSVVYHSIGDIGKAVSLAEKVLRLAPELPDVYLNLGTFYKELGKGARAKDMFQLGTKVAPDDLRFAYQLSWLLATAQEKTVRDGERAVRLAVQACEATNYESPGTLDALAAAYAESGEFKKAIRIGQKAKELAQAKGQGQLASDIDARLSLYRAGKAYRERIPGVKRA